MLSQRTIQYIVSAGASYYTGSAAQGISLISTCSQRKDIRDGALGDDAVRVDLERRQDHPHA